MRRMKMIFLKIVNSSCCDAFLLPSLYTLCLSIRIIPESIAFHLVLRTDIPLLSLKLTGNLLVSTGLHYYKMLSK